ncbi:MAG: EAL domain-containing protein [Gammaproteobacteria bacterium]|nr:EAL domain-containing protein [Gammaproteobacteria bacterium]MBP9728657.1 EAL domain-containing protein [Gammaproteobacteria bacterium]
MPRDTEGDGPLPNLLGEQDFKVALATQAFYLLYQPRLDLKTRSLSGVEVLIRWHHPLRGVLLPSTFIPLAEQTGFILPIGTWVLQKALAQHKRWQAEGYSMNMAINISNKQLEAPDFVAQLASMLAEHVLEASTVDLDLHETVCTKAHEPLRGVMHDLKQLGVRLSIDNFGLKNLQVEDLKGLPIYSLKIDQSFVGALPEATDMASRVQNMIQLGHQLEAKVVVKGIESKAQFNALESYGCDEIQGFYYSRPLSVSSFPEMFKRLQHFSVVP